MALGWGQRSTQQAEQALGLLSGGAPPALTPCPAVPPLPWGRQKRRWSSYTTACPGSWELLTRRETTQIGEML